MRTLDVHVDREGYKHIECELNVAVNRDKELQAVAFRHDLDYIVAIDRRVDAETGFEFFHVKGL